MNATATINAATYTHVGNRVNVGRAYYSDLAHRDTSGKDHALNRDPQTGKYTALCGETVAYDSYEENIVPKERYNVVTCKRCRKCINQAK